jgi:hypothetical protein
MAKTKSSSAFVGLWHIVSMSEWDEEYINEEGQPFIEFEKKGSGKFQFGLVSGDISFVQSQRDGRSAVEWTWEGMDEMDECSGRGWAILEGDELHGMIFFHGGDNSDFVATRPKAQKRRKTRK